jgi:catechol 2,3-dioxygenase-like lactoylglutathione lyase family enzyme
MSRIGAQRSVTSVTSVAHHSFAVAERRSRPFEPFLFRPIGGYCAPQSGISRTIGIIMAATVSPSEQLVVEIFVRDLRLSLAFYQRLGFSLLREELAFAELAWEDSRLLLEEFKQMPSPPPFPVANIRVMVADVDAYRALAGAMGARIFKEIGDRYYGLRDFTMLGPDGVAIRFATQLRTS